MVRSFVVAIPTVWGIPYVRHESRAGGDPVAGPEAVMLVAAATFVTAGAVTALDAAVFAKQTNIVVDEPSASSKPVVSPGFAFVRGGATAGVSGRF